MFDEHITYTIVEGRGDPNRVTMFGFSFCDHCHTGLSFLKEKGIAHRYTFIDELGQYDRIRAKSFFQSRGGGKEQLFPVLYFNEDDFLLGFSEALWKEKLKEKKIL